MGILGTLPTSIFGPFSGLTMLAGGALIGAATVAASLRLVPHNLSPPTGEPTGTTETGATDIDSLVQQTMTEVSEDSDSTRRSLIDEMQQAARQKTHTCPYCHQRMP
jgi:hypothetical protein